MITVVFLILAILYLLQVPVCTSPMVNVRIRCGSCNNALVSATYLQQQMVDIFVRKITTLELLSSQYLETSSTSTSGLFWKKRAIGIGSR
jgi:hypothetical protein